MGHDVCRGRCARILQRIGQVVLLIVNQGRIQRDRRLSHALQLNHALLRQPGGFGDLLSHGITSQFLVKITSDAFNLIDQFDHVYRNVNCACVLRDGAADCLADPPGRVGAETEAARGIKFLRGTNESQVALLHKIEQANPVIVVAFGDAHNQAKIRFNQSLLRLHISIHHSPRQGLFLFAGQEGKTPDLREILSNGVINAEVVFRLLVLTLLFHILVLLFLKYIILQAQHGPRRSLILYTWQSSLCQSYHVKPLLYL